MTIALSDINFSNDFYNVTLTNGSVLTLVKIDESLQISTGVTEINGYIMYITTDTGSIVNCSTVIGYTDSLTEIASSRESDNGSTLTDSNLEYCTLEVSDE